MQRGGVEGVASPQARRHGRARIAPRTEFRKAAPQGWPPRVPSGGEKSRGQSRQGPRDPHE
eukprot:7713849-Pyramimonas_sp.AAC.1